MRDHTVVLRSMFDSFKEIVDNERGNVAIGGDDVPRGDAPVDDTPDITPEPVVDHTLTEELTEDPAAPGTEPAPEPPAEDPRDTEIRSLREQMEELSSRFETKGAEQPKKDETPALTWQTMNPDQKVQTFKSFGLHVSQKTGEDGQPYQEVNIDPKGLIDGVIQRIQMAVQMANDYADKLVHGNVSDIRFETLVGSMEKKAGFSDVRQYSEAVKQYLAERYQPKDHSNPKFIEDGYYWAKGKNLKNVVKKALQSQDRNKNIVKPASGASPKSAVKGRLTAETMSDEQRRIAEATFRSDRPEIAHKKYAALF